MNTFSDSVSRIKVSSTIAVTIEADKIKQAGGDLSEFNVLLDSTGPVIIDLPQAVNAASNNNAFAMLERDVNNMRTAFGFAAPELLETEYAREIWKAYEAGELKPDSVLTGRFARDLSAPDVDAVLNQIEDERREAEERQRRREAADAA